MPVMGIAPGAAMQRPMRPAVAMVAMANMAPCGRSAGATPRVPVRGTPGDRSAPVHAVSACGARATGRTCRPISSDRTGPPRSPNAVSSRAVTIHVRRSTPLRTTARLPESRPATLRTTWPGSGRAAVRGTGLSRSAGSAGTAGSPYRGVTSAAPPVDRSTAAAPAPPAPSAAREGITATDFSSSRVSRS